MTYNLVLNRCKDASEGLRRSQSLGSWVCQLPLKGDLIDIYSWRAEDNISEFLFNATCTDVCKVILRPTFIWSPGVVLNEAQQLESFAQSVGYSSWEEILRCLVDNPSGEFVGYLIKWINPNVTLSVSD